MSPFDLPRVGLFCGAVVLVYYATFRWCLDRWRGRKPDSPFGRRFAKAGPLLLALAGIGLVCMLYGFFIAPNGLTVTRYTIETPKLPKGVQLRIVQIADLHVRQKGPRERALPELVRALKPDLILHSGDFFGRNEGVRPIILELLRSWNVPQFACEGNMDRLGDFSGVLREAGVVPLSYRTMAVTVRGARLTISGFPPGSEDIIRAMLQDLPADTFNIVLYHHPEGFPETWNTRTDLMLAGHTHGGQVCLPGYGALITLDRYGKRWESGKFDEHGVTLIVSRGIGCEPFTPEVRFWCPPEVVAIDLVGTGSWRRGVGIADCGSGISDLGSVSVPSDLSDRSYRSDTPRAGRH